MTKSTPMPDGCIRQVVKAWERARDHLVSAAHRGREAQAIWDNAQAREMHAHRRMMEALGPLLDQPPSGRTPQREVKDILADYGVRR